MESRKRKLCFGTVIVGLLVLLSFVTYELSMYVQNANAIPAFARKYDLACNTCHVPGFPKLNDFGNLFRDQGYQFGGDRDLPTHESISMGYWPVSFRSTVGYQSASVRTDGSGVSTGGFGFTFLDFMSFGTLHRDIAFGVVFVPRVAGSFFNTRAIPENQLPFAWVRLMRLEKFLGVKSEGNDYLLNLRVGKFEGDAPFSDVRSPTLNTPIVMYHYRAGTPWTATIGGTATRSYTNPNSFALGIFGEQQGVELSGIKKTSITDGFFRYSLAGFTSNDFNGVLGGCPAGTACGTGGRTFSFYGHVTQSFGGYGIVTGQRIGFSGAYGDAPTLVNPTCPACSATGGNGQPYYRFGPDVSLTFDGQWNLFGAWFFANDSKNLFTSQGIANAQNASWHGAFVELDWYPTVLPIFNVPNWLLGYRFDVIRNKRQGDPTFDKSFNDVDSHTFLARYYIHQSTRTDIALHAEYNTYRTKGVGIGGGDLLGQTMLIGLDFAY